MFAFLKSRNVRLNKGNSFIESFETVYKRQCLRQACEWQELSRRAHDEAQIELACLWPESDGSWDQIFTLARVAYWQTESAMRSAMAREAMDRYNEVEA